MLENRYLNVGKMAKLLRTAATAFFFTLSAGSVLAAERVGSTIAAQSTVSGEGAVGKRIIATADPIYRDERLRSNLTGLGQFELGDGTKHEAGARSQCLPRYRPLRFQWWRQGQKRYLEIAFRDRTIRHRRKR